MATFLIAFLLMCIPQPSTWKLILVGAVTVLTVAAIVWCIVMAWEPHGQTAEADDTQNEANVAEEQGDNIEERHDEASLSRPRKVPWSWPRLLFRRRTSGSYTTVVSVTEVDVAEEQGDNLEERHDAASLCRPRKVSWSWPGFLFRRRTTGSDTAGVGVIPMYELQLPPQAYLRS